MLSPITKKEIPVDDVIPSLAYINKPGLGTIDVYQVTDTEWYAGADGPSCVAKFLADSSAGNNGVPADFARENVDEFGPPELVSKPGMERLRFQSDDKDMISFREALDDLIVGGAEFPIFFASTEY